MKTKFPSSSRSRFTRNLAQCLIPCLLLLYYIGLHERCLSSSSWEVTDGAAVACTPARLEEGRWRSPSEPSSNLLASLSGDTATRGGGQTVPHGNDLRPCRHGSERRLGRGRGGFRPEDRRSPGMMPPYTRASVGPPQIRVGRVTIYDNTLDNLVLVVPCITSSMAFNSGGRGSGRIGITEVCGESFDDGACGYRFLIGDVSNVPPCAHAT
jgi:hypothetical protein